MKKHILTVLLAIAAAVCLALGVAGCAGETEVVAPNFYIGEDGHLYGELDGETTDYGQVVGADGQDGQDGADGQDGEDGKDGATGPAGRPGSTGATGPQGPAGADGEDGETPYIGENGNWWVGDTDTEIKAQGESGQRGSLWFYGETNPAEYDFGTQTLYALDKYLNTSNGSVWNYDGTTWTMIYHNHEYTLGDYDETCHYFVCDCGEEYSEEHTFVDGLCTVCKYQQGTSAGLETSANADQNSVTITGIGDFTGSEVVIPSEINGLPVTAIASGAFAGNTTITSVTVSEGVTSIGNRAFRNCTALENVVIPDSVTAIGSTSPLVTVTTFEGCTNLKSVSIGAGISNLPSTLFDDCKGITDIEISANNQAYSSANNCILNKDGTTLVVGFNSSTIPSTVTTIGDNAFAYCTGLTEITIPDKVTAIGENAFDNCTNLTTFDSGDGVTTIGNYAFNFCTSLETIVLGKNVNLSEQTDYSYGPFARTTGVKNVTVDADNLNIKSDGNCILNKDGTTVIAGFACSVIPEGVTRIGNFSFAQQGLTTIKIPSSVTEIGDTAFGNNDTLEELIIDSTSITKIESSAFLALTTPYIYFNGNATQWQTFLTLANNAPYNGGAMIGFANSAGKVYLYSETQPEGEGNYWHYVEGVPTIWETTAADGE